LTSYSLLFLFLLLTFNCQLSTVNCQLNNLSTDNHVSDCVFYPPQPWIRLPAQLLVNSYVLFHISFYATNSSYY
ncbi:hypothetical protein, partial [Bacteroides sp. 51]|uniref:hypothetical protein n=1 Tax=Bacteroides sp. 51 TaxID=2302938 RepID=UPI0019402A6E